jgi:dienelactone hydrolase
MSKDDPQGFHNWPDPRQSNSRSSVKKKPNMILIVLGIVGALMLTGLVVCCGGLAWFAQFPSTSASAKEPFMLDQPLLSNTGGNQPAKPMEAGVTLQEFSLSGSGPGTGMRIWVYLPEGAHQVQSLPCVLICGAGAAPMNGMRLSDGDSVEFTPYVHAGFAVVAYDQDGEADDDQPSPESYEKFKASCAGLVNARNAFEFALRDLPSINPKRIYTVGHSSAASTAILFAEHEPRIAGCVAYAPCTDLPRRVPGFAVRALGTQMPGLADFIVQSSPRTHESQLKCPIMVFHSTLDDNVEHSESKQFVDRLKDAGKNATLVTTEVGDHYSSMINEGIPKGIEWLKSH